KLILVCRFVRDLPEDYTDSDEYGKTNETDIYFNDIMLEYEKHNCLPQGLSKAGKKNFYKLIVRWSNEVKQMFLNPKLFIVVEEANKGRSFKVNFGSMQGWCNSTDDASSHTPYTSTTTTSKPEINDLPYVCYDESVVGRWLVPETEGIKQLDKLIKQHPNFLEKIHKYAKRQCCPYGAIRDRLEIFNDGIDFLHHLQGIKSFNKVEFTGAVNHDFSNLKDRLEYLILINNKNGGNITTGKCCYGFKYQLKKLENDFENNLKSLILPKTNWNVTSFVDSHKALQKSYETQLKIFQNLQALFSNKNNVYACCDSKNQKILVLEQFIKNVKLEATIENKENLFDNVRDSLANVHEIISGTNSIITLEDIELQKLYASCTKNCHTNLNKKIIQTLKGKMYALSRKYGEINPIFNINWAKLNKSVEEVNSRINKLPEIISNLEKIPNQFLKIMKTISPMKSSLNITSYLKEFPVVSKTIEEADITNKKHIIIFNMHELNSEKQTKKLKDKLNVFEESIRKYNSTPSNKKISSFEQNFDHLSKQIKDLNDFEIKNLAMTIQNRKKEFDSENEKFLKLFEGYTKNMKDKIEEFKKKNSVLEHRLIQLENKLIETPTKFAERLNHMEVALKAISKLYGLPEESYLGRIELIHKNLKDLNESIDRMMLNADECIYECDFGELPSIAQLLIRVKVLRAKLTK
ncbi:hypothetical protein KR074_003755, partial [Drosophila pseudoananassae]